MERGYYNPESTLDLRQSTTLKSHISWFKAEKSCFGFSSSLTKLIRQIRTSPPVRPHLQRSVPSVRVALRDESSETRLAAVLRSALQTVSVLLTLALWTNCLSCRQTVKENTFSISFNTYAYISVSYFNITHILIYVPFKVT